MDQEIQAPVTFAVQNQNTTPVDTANRQEFISENGFRCLECKEFYDYGRRRFFKDIFCGHVICRNCVPSSTSNGECTQCQDQISSGQTTGDELNIISAEPRDLVEVSTEVSGSSNCISTTEALDAPAVKMETDRSESDSNSCDISSSSSDQFDCTNSIYPKTEEDEQTEFYVPDSGIEVSIEEFVIPYYHGDYIQYEGDSENFPACLPVAEEVIIEPEPVEVSESAILYNHSVNSASDSNLGNDDDINSSAERFTSCSEIEKVHEGLDSLKLVNNCKDSGDAILRNALARKPKASTKSVTNNVTKPRNRFLRTKEKDSPSTSPSKDDFLKQLNVHRNEEEKSDTDELKPTHSPNPSQKDRPRDLTIRRSPRKLVSDASPVECALTNSPLPSDLLRASRKLICKNNPAYDISPDTKMKRIDPSTRLISRTTFKPSLFQQKELIVPESVEVKVEPKIEPEESPIYEDDDSNFLNDTVDTEGSQISSTISDQLTLPLNIKMEDVKMAVAESETTIPETNLKIETTTDPTDANIPIPGPSTSCTSTRDDEAMPLTERNEVERREKSKTRACQKKLPNTPTSSRVKISVPKRSKKTPVPSLPHITVVKGDSEESYRCELCRKSFKTRAHIRYHEFCVPSEARPKPFHCELCNKGFIAKSHFVYHLRTHTDERPFVCEVCNKGFNASGKLTRHAKIHTGDKPFACEHCPREFSNSQGLKSHELVHTGERPFACDVCPMRFKGLTNLKKHTLTHSGERPHACEHCGKSFGLKWTLDMHVKTHSNYRPFACNECAKAFGNRKDLRRHQTIHSSVRPFKCPTCGVAFRRKDNLDRHIKNIHNSVILGPLGPRATVNGVTAQ